VLLEDAEMADDRAMERECRFQGRVFRGRRTDKCFGSIRINIEVVYWGIKLNIGQVDTLTIDAIIKMIPLWKGRLQNLAAEKFVDKQCRYAALTACGIGGQPLSTGLQGPGS
jgi:hypothetical protein